MYYEKTIALIRTAIERKAPGTKPVNSLPEGKQPSLSHILWACEDIFTLDKTSYEAAFIASMRIGWVSAHAELSGIITSIDLRNAVLEDRLNGFDKPH